MIDQGLFARYSKVVYSQAEANALGLEIDHDDSHCFADGPFALLIHGMQPAGSNAMAAVQAIKKVTGSLGYNKKNRGK